MGHTYTKNISLIHLKFQINCALYFYSLHLVTLVFPFTDHLFLLSPMIFNRVTLLVTLTAESNSGWILFILKTESIFLFMYLFHKYISILNLINNMGVQFHTNPYLLMVDLWPELSFPLTISSFLGNSCSSLQVLLKCPESLNTHYMWKASFWSFRSNSIMVLTMILYKECCFEVTRYDLRAKCNPRCIFAVCSMSFKILCQVPIFNEWRSASTKRE
jgi:hypothetical protein